MAIRGNEQQRREGKWGELILFGGVAGAVAALIKFPVHHAFVWTHLAKPFYPQLNAMLIHGHDHLKDIPDKLFGELGDMAIGALFGILASFILRHSRPRYHWWLGIGLGFGIWFGSLAFGNLTKIIKPNETDPWSLFAHFLAMIFFGLLIVAASRIWPAYRKRIAD